MKRVISKEAYEAAKELIKLFEKQEKVIAETNLADIKADLDEYFKKNYVSGCLIKKYDVNVSVNFMGKVSAEILFYDPYFDEDYEDEKADDAFEEIGKKYDINLRVESGIHGK